MSALSQGGGEIDVHLPIRRPGKGGTLDDGDGMGKLVSAIGTANSILWNAIKCFTMGMQ